MTALGCLREGRRSRARRIDRPRAHDYLRERHVLGGDIVGLLAPFPERQRSPQ